MAIKNRKQKKSVIGKFPLGGQIGGLSPELLALMQKYMQENGIAGLPMDTTPVTDSTEITNLGDSLTPDLMGGIDTPPMKAPTTSLGDALSKGLTEKAGAFSMLGGIETAFANKPGYAPDVNQGITGGALYGLGAGLSMGGPMGGLIGLLGGGAMGFMNSGQKREDYETALERSKRQRAKDRTVDPFMGVLYAEEGGIMPGDVPAEELSPVQTEIHEMVLTPSGILTKTKAKEEHDDMDADDVTDILPAGSIIFSNSKDNMLNITEDISETVLGYGTAFYSEEGEDSEVEAVEFEDVLDKGKKKMTFANIASNIKDKFSTIANKKDVFANISNVENMQARTPWLMKLIELQDKTMGTSSLPSTQQAQAFKNGGVVKKYVDGGLIDLIMGTLKKQNIWPYGGSGDGSGGGPGAGAVTGNGLGGDNSELSIEDLIQKHRDFLDNTKSNLETENQDRAAGDKELFNKLNNNNIMANAVIGPMGYLMQNTQVKPAYTDTNLSGAMYRPGSNQAVQGIANTGLGQANALAQELMRQGVNPTDAISMTASARNSATNSANEINFKQLQKNEQLDRDKYTFLQTARTANDAADVKAYNDTTDNQNKVIAGLASSGQTFMKDASSIDVANNTWRTQRAKDYYDSITNLDKSTVDLSTKLYEIDAAKQESAAREESMRKFLESLKTGTSSGGAGGGTDGTGNGGSSETPYQPGDPVKSPDVGDTPKPYEPPAPANKVTQPELIDSDLPSPKDAATMNPKQIGDLQKIINKDRAARNLPPIPEDDDWGPITEKALIEAEGAKNSRRVGKQMPEGLIVPTPISGDVPATPAETPATPDAPATTEKPTDNSGTKVDEQGKKYTPTADGGKEYETVGKTDKEGNYEKTKEVYDKEGKLVSSRKETVNDKYPKSKGSYEETKYDKNGGVAEETKVTKDADGTYDNTRTITYGKDKDGNSTGKVVSIVENTEYRPEGEDPFKQKSVASYDDNGKFKEVYNYKIDKDNKEILINHQFYAKDTNGDSIYMDISMQKPDYKKAILTINSGTPAATLKSFNSYEEAKDYISKNYKQ